LTESKKKSGLIGGVLGDRESGGHSGHTLVRQCYDKMVSRSKTDMALRDRGLPGRGRAGDAGSVFSLSDIYPQTQA
jgi:hypothetical protein